MSSLFDGGANQSLHQQEIFLIPCVCERSPASMRTGTPKKHSFGDWAGPTLPSFENHLRTDTGAHAGTAPTVSHEDDTFPPPRHIPEGQHLQPDPLGFGPTSSVTVPPPLPVTNMSRVTGSSQGVTGLGELLGFNFFFVMKKARGQKSAKPEK